jgi:predicted nucleic acid-binding protein
MRVFLDANILFSAADPRSATRRLLEALLKYAEAVTSPHAVEEAYRNLEVKRTQYVEDFKDLVKRLNITHAFADLRDFHINLSKEDIAVLGGAVGSRCTHFWTGDKRHFGKLYGKTVQGVVIINGIRLVDMLIKLGWKP